MIDYENKSFRSGSISSQSGVPLKIFVSTRTGRRYLCLYLPSLRRFHNARLDSILSITIKEPWEDYERTYEALLAKYGYSPEAIADKCRAVMKRR